MPTFFKPLEVRWRRALLAAAHRPFGGRVTAAPQALVQVPPRGRILVIRLERIGDVLVGIPVLRALRARHPEARIELLVSRANRAVADAVRPFVDHLWIYEKTVMSGVSLLLALRRRSYDVIVDLIDHPSTNAQLVIRWCRPRVAVGLLHAESGLYTHAAPALDPAIVHPVERFAQLLLPFGIDPSTEPLDLEYPLGPTDQERARAALGPSDRLYRIGINVSCRQAERYWGTGKYVDLARRIVDRHRQFAVWVCGAPQDAPEVARIASATDTRAVPPRPSLSEFAAIVREFDLFVTPDTVAVHIAAAWKRPTVALYHPEAGVAPWTPYHTPHRAVMGAPDIPSIQVDDVSAAVDDLIAERFGGPTPTDA
jgi:ADP-heptose:LPS heptosyltransferase